MQTLFRMLAFVRIKLERKSIFPLKLPYIWHQIVIYTCLQLF